MTISSHDEFLWHTLSINARLDAGRYETIPTLQVMFAPMANDLVWGAAFFNLYSWGAPGNGSYVRDNGFFFATGGLGLALTAGTALARAAGNRSRRRQAEANAAPRWLHIDQGTVYVSNLGFYLAAPNGLHTWTWEAVTSMQMLHPGQASLTGTSNNGPIHWLLATDAAELIFTLWARVRHPNHPQLTSRAWLDLGWYDRMAKAGRALPTGFS